MGAARTHEGVLHGAPHINRGSAPLNPRPDGCRWGMPTPAASTPSTPAASAAADALAGREAKLVIVFCSDSHDLEALVAGSAPSVGDGRR